VMGEHEIAKAMVADACARFGKAGDVPASWRSEGEQTGDARHKAGRDEEREGSPDAR
jgi:hypothetical protein